MTRKKSEPNLAAFERPLPHNLEAERAVIGAILIRNQVFPDVATIVRPEHFYRLAHARVYASLARLLDRPGAAADLITITTDLSQHGHLDEVGGPAYLSSLIDGVPRSTNAPHYARIVRDKAKLRELIAASDRMMCAAYDDIDPADEILASADRAIVKLRHGDGLSRMRLLEETAGDLVADITWRADHRGEFTGITSGFQSIDDLTGGFQKGELVLVAARPSVGKTTWAINFAAAAAAAGKRGAIFSLEMRRRQLELRMVSSIAEVPLTRIARGYMNEEELSRVSQAVVTVAGLPLAIDDTASRTVWDIRAECRRLMANGGLDFGVVDYVQLMAADKITGNRNQELTEISRALKVMTDELGIPLVVLSQLNRSAENRADTRPKLADLRDSGALEQDADVVCFLHRKHHRENGPTQFIVEKARNGPTGTVILTVERELVRFLDGGTDVFAEPDPEENEPRQVDILSQRPSRRR